MWSPRLGMRELVACVCASRAFVWLFCTRWFCPSSLPFGVGGWLRLVTMAFPGIIYLLLWNGYAIINIVWNVYFAGSSYLRSRKPMWGVRNALMANLASHYTSAFSQGLSHCYQKLYIRSDQLISINNLLISINNHKLSHIEDRSGYDPRHDKTNKMSVRPAKTQISLGIRPVWSESLLSAWRKLGSWAIYWAHREDWSDWRMPRLICVFAGRTDTLLVLSCRGSYILCTSLIINGFVRESDVLLANQSYHLMQG